MLVIKHHAPRLRKGPWPSLAFFSALLIIAACGGEGVESSPPQAACTDAAVECPSTGTSCVLAACQAGACATTNAAAGTPCADHGGAVCNGDGACVQCLNAQADCPQPINECQIATCAAAICGVIFVADNTPTQAGQVPGDCKRSICDAGVVKVVNDDTDATDDLNPCTADACNAGVSVFTPVAGACAQSGGTVCADPAGPKAGLCVECNIDADCVVLGDVCDPAQGSNTCVQPTCVDGVKDGSETDIDCGGSCLACPNTLSCGVSSDCQSSFCAMGICAPCASSADCVAIEHCDIAVSGGTCVPDNPIGVACNDAAQCLSGQCADGVCCNNACDGSCQACNLAGSVGSCTDIAAGTDPVNECPDAALCSAGACVAPCTGIIGVPPLRVVGQATQVLTSDLNGDGLLDVVALVSDTLSVFLSTGNGTFAPKVDYAIASTGDYLLAEDFNGDNKPDLAFTLFYTHKLGVRLNNGDGTFAAATYFPAGNGPSSMIAADFNGDGELDIATANRTAGSVSVFKGVGNGAFLPKVDHVVAAYQYNAMAAFETLDLNGDSKPDLLFLGGGSKEMGVLINDGSGSFSSSIYQPSASGFVVYSAAIADFNGDDRPDVVVPDQLTDTINVIINNGDGTFAPTVGYPAGTDPASVVSVDLNNDNKPDIAVNPYAGATVSVLLNNGNGTFAAKTDYPLGGSILSITPGDVNGDGKVDLLVADVGNALIVFLNDGSGTLTAGLTYSTGANINSQSDAPLIADLSGDGKVDILVPVILKSTSDILIPFLGDGTGTFIASLEYNAAYGPVSEKAGDLNGDGKLDLAVLSYASQVVTVLLNKGDGTFSAGVDYPTGNHPESLAIADINNDNKPDLAVANQFSDTVSVLLNMGAGAFAAKIDSPVGSNPIAIAAADFNDDGKVDLACANFGPSPGTVSVLLGKGNGTFFPMTEYATGEGAIDVAASDLNFDGKPDLVVANWMDDTTSVLLNNGNGTFAATVDYPTGLAPRSIAVFGANRSLAVANQGENTVSVLLNNGNGTFGPKTDYGTGAQPLSVTAFGVSGGLAVANSMDDTVSVLLNNGDDTLAPRIDYATGPHPTSVAVGDLNADGRLDLAVANEASYTTSVLLMQSCMP